jgi:pimeloyl-ACP methyl ester carboxylesterase
MPPDCTPNSLKIGYDALMSELGETFIFVPGNGQGAWIGREGHYVPEQRMREYRRRPHGIEDYGALLRVVGGLGLKGLLHTPDWSRLDFTGVTLGLLIEAIENEAPKSPSGKVMVGGFSYGSVLAVLAASQRANMVSGVVACSLSPVFIERPSSVCPRGGRLELPRLDCPVQLYYGREEMLHTKRMHGVALEQVSNQEVVGVQVPGWHDVLTPQYLRALELELPWLMDNVRAGSVHSEQTNRCHIAA